MIPVVEVKVNGILVGHAIIDDFFNKYGNCDGKNIVGLVAEAHFVNKLRSMGYNVRLLLSHNVEIIRVEHEHFSYECPRGYGEALERMPDEVSYPRLKASGLPASKMELAGIPTSRGSTSAGESGLPHPLIFILHAEIQSL